MNTAALTKLWNVTQIHQGTSGARAAAGVLLGLYNGTRFPFDLTDLRVLDASNLQAAIEVINGDASNCQMEVHAWLNQLTGRQDFGQRFEHLAHEWRREGRCKREHLDPVSPAHVTIAAATPEGSGGAAAPELLDMLQRVLSEALADADGAPSTVTLVDAMTLVAKATGNAS